ncbi:MAG TPA: T9SS type A sorting domain-containing protein [Saprospiraceae bacterium]|nr:T9SS type A sorting domain-containing protein [Saprospiraceae bacterium]
MKYGIYLYLIQLLFSTNHLHAQCDPISASSCEKATVLCALQELNSYCCQNIQVENPDDYPCGRNALCNAGGSPHNTSWWAFVTSGGEIKISISINNCTNNQGLQFGIWGDCNCGEELACNPFCSGPSGTLEISANLEACKKYYFFIDGCSGDVCDFCLNITGGDSPQLSALGDIIGTGNICEGFCNTTWSVHEISDNCPHLFEWTWDGMVVGNNARELTLDDEWGSGSFTLCVNAYVGDGNKSSICNQSGPTCKTILINPRIEYRGPDRSICIDRFPFEWQGVTVDKAGDFKATFIEANCCKFDSIVQFLTLPTPLTDTVYYIACTNSDYYQDTITKTYYKSCANPVLVKLPKSSKEWACDSSYHLFAIYPEFQSTIKGELKYGKKIINVQTVDTTHYCGNDSLIKYEFNYRWYLKSNPGITLSLTDTLEVTGNNDYCVDRIVRIKYGKIYKDCIQVFCDSINEDDIVGFNEIEKRKTSIQLIPNPANQAIYLLYPQDLKIEELQIFNQQGLPILNANKLNLVHSNLYTIQLNIGQLVPGIYYLKIKTNRGILFKKFSVIR